MFMLDYVYIPLTGSAYVTSDMCDSFVIEEFDDRQVRMELTHSAKNLQGQTVKFSSFIIIPKQRIGVSKYEG